MNYCLGFLFDRGLENVLLIRKAEPGWQRGRFNGVGGKIEEGETPSMAMQREAYEELPGKHILDGHRWKSVTRLELGDGDVVCVFAASAFDLTQLPGTEKEPAGIFSVDNLPLSVIPNLKWLVPLARCVLHGSDGNYVPTYCVFHR